MDDNIYGGKTPHGLSTRAHGALIRLGVTTWSGLAMKMLCGGEYDRVRGLGEVTRNELITALSKRGIILGDRSCVASRILQARLAIERAQSLISELASITAVVEDLIKDCAPASPIDADADSPQASTIRS